MQISMCCSKGLQDQQQGSSEPCLGEGAAALCPEPCWTPVCALVALGAPHRSTLPLACALSSETLLSGPMQAPMKPRSGPRAPCRQT